MSEDVMIHFIDKMGVELLFVIGILVILAYISIKTIPAYKELKVKKIEIDKEIAEKQLDLETQREVRKSDEHAKDLEQDRSRTEQIARQTVILENMSRGFEAQQVQLAALTNALEADQGNTKSIGEVVNDTNRLVTDIHRAVIDSQRSA